MSDSPRLPPIRSRPDPERLPWCAGVPAEVLRAAADELVRRHKREGKPLPWDYAVLDYMAETDNDQRAERRTVQQRAKRWGWAFIKQTMSYRMALIREDARDWRTFYAEKRAAARAEAKPPPASDAARKPPPANPAPSDDAPRNGTSRDAHAGFDAFLQQEYERGYR